MGGVVVTSNNNFFVQRIQPLKFGVVGAYTDCVFTKHSSNSFINFRRFHTCKFVSASDLFCKKNNVSLTCVLSYNFKFKSKNFLVFRKKFNVYFYLRWFFKYNLYLLFILFYKLSLNGIKNVNFRIRRFFLLNRFFFKILSSNINFFRSLPFFIFFKNNSYFLNTSFNLKNKNINAFFNFMFYSLFFKLSFLGLKFFNFFIFYLAKFNKYFGFFYRLSPFLKKIKY